MILFTFVFSLFFSCLISIIKSTTPAPPVPEFTGQCGITAGNKLCENNLCCSSAGWCGLTDAYCGVGCQSNCNGNNTNFIYKCNKANTTLFTFDDGPSENFPLLLSTLRKLNIKVVFFVLGENIKGNEKILKEAVLQGHTIGVHTWSHPSLVTLNDTEIIKEITSTAREIYRVTGKYPQYFRPPYLDYNNRVDAIVKALSFKTLWTNMDSNDWRDIANPDKVLQNIKDILKNKEFPSYITLQHDRILESVKLVKEIASFVRKAGIKIVDVDTCLGSKSY